MKNQLFTVVFAICTAFSLSSPYFKARQDAKIRVKRNWWLQFFKTTTKMPTTTKPTTTEPTTTKPTTIPPVAPQILSNISANIPPGELRKLMEAYRNNKLEEYLGVDKAMSMKIDRLAKKPPPPDPQGAVGSSGGGGVKSCGCLPTISRQFIPNPSRHAGIFLPSNCILTYTCGGSCLLPEHQECKSVDTDFTTHYKYYYYLPHVGKPPEMKHYTIELHKRCDCVCKQRSCPERKYFENKYCDCNCKAEFTKQVLQCQWPLKYNEDTCSCECAVRPVCARQNQIVDEKTCQCRTNCPQGSYDRDGSGHCSVVAMNNGK